MVCDSDVLHKPIVNANRVYDSFKYFSASYIKALKWLNGSAITTLPHCNNYCQENVKAVMKYTSTYPDSYPFNFVSFHYVNILAVVIT